MPAIADQVTNLELDHADALAKIDALTATNAALASENAALNKYADEIKAMVESVASGALHMLQAARAPIVAAVEKVETALVDEAKTIAREVRQALPTTEMWAAVADVSAIDAKINAATEQRAVALDALEQGAMQGDSGDAQPEPIVPPANLFKKIETAVVKDVQVVRAEITAAPEAVERMLHHSSASSAPPVTSIRRPVDLTMHVDHNDEGLPIFLRRGTAFEAMTRRGIDT